MNTAAVPLQRYRDSLAQMQPQLTGADLPWLAEHRRQARDSFARLGFPQRREEAWRYTRTDKLLDNDFAPFATNFELPQDLDIEALLLPEHASHRLVFVNGCHIPALSDRDGIPAGITVGSLRQLIQRNPILPAKWLGQAAGEPQHGFAALNSAAIHDGLVIHIPRSLQTGRPIEVLHLSLGMDEAIMVQPRSLIVLEAGAQADLIERYAGIGDAQYFNNGVSEIFLGQGAELGHTRLQQENADAFHQHSVFVNQSDASDYRHTSFSLGAAWARTEVNVNFRREDAHATLNGLYTAGDRQLTDFHLNIVHALPGCESQTRFKGLLHGKGRAVFDGRVLVEPQAQKTVAHLNNANLLLTRDAEVDTKPQLEIHADDVKCSHGTTVGQLEPAQLFYLRSRGIDALEARRLLCLGFAGEVLDQCEIPQLREVVGAAVRDKLTTTGQPQTRR